MLPYALIASAGLALLYAEMAVAHSGSTAVGGTVAAVVFVAMLIAFLLPPRIWRYTNADVAPRVMSQVVARAGMASALVLVAGGVVWFLVPQDPIALLQELYLSSLMIIALFHGLGGAIASHVVYLQQTKQYNSNQLVAVLVLVTVVLFILLLYTLGFDYAFPRDAYIHIRDLTIITLVLLAYGRAIYLMAHH